MLTHWKKEAQSAEFLGSWDFQPGERKTVTITGTGKGTVHSPDGKASEKMIVFLDGGLKPLVLNATNGKTIAKALGTPYVE